MAPVTRSQTLASRNLPPKPPPRTHCIDPSKLAPTGQRKPPTAKALAAAYKTLKLDPDSENESDLTASQKHDSLVRDLTACATSCIAPPNPQILRLNRALGTINAHQAHEAIMKRVKQELAHQDKLWMSMIHNGDLVNLRNGKMRHMMTKEFVESGGSITLDSVKGPEGCIEEGGFRVGGLFRPVKTKIAAKMTGVKTSVRKYNQKPEERTWVSAKLTVED